MTTVCRFLGQVQSCTKAQIDMAKSISSQDWSADAWCCQATGCLHAESRVVRVQSAANGNNNAWVSMSILASSGAAHVKQAFNGCCLHQVLMQQPCFTSLDCSVGLKLSVWYQHMSKRAGRAAFDHKIASFGPCRATGRLEGLTSAS